MEIQHSAENIHLKLALEALEQRAKSNLDHHNERTALASHELPESTSAQEPAGEEVGSNGDESVSTTPKLQEKSAWQILWDDVADYSGIHDEYRNWF
jgi:hypothetical protein